jgi:hypothetical protein
MTDDPRLVRWRELARDVLSVNDADCLARSPRLIEERHEILESLRRSPPEPPSDSLLEELRESQNALEVRLIRILAELRAQVALARQTRAVTRSGESDSASPLFVSRKA